nr:hypothetical protein [Tanacetum cinerariifolium]
MDKLLSVQQPRQQLIGQHTNLSGMQQQHMGSQSNASGQQQSLGSQSESAKLGNDVANVSSTITTIVTTAGFQQQVDFSNKMLLISGSYINNREPFQRLRQVRSNGAVWHIEKSALL